ncbi:MAG: hypothetical protein ACYTG1_11540, partial [Planctomycetota bacterium]
MSATLSLVALTVSPASADDDAAATGRLWQVRGGTTTITFDAEAMAPAEVRLGGAAAFGDVLPESPERRLAVRRGSSLTFSVVDGSVAEVVGGSILHLGDITLETPRGPLVFSDLAIAPVPEQGFSASWLAKPVRGGEGFTLGRVKAGFDASSSTITIRSAELRLAPQVAAALGDARFAESVIGAVTIRAGVRAVSDPAGDFEGPPEAGERASASSRAAGPDMTFCQLYGLYMPTGSRVGDVVGLAVATTSWNIGDADLMWFPMPNEEHPFIVMNL